MEEGLFLWSWKFVMSTIALVTAQCFTFMSLMDSRFDRKKTIQLSVGFVVFILAVCLGGCWFGKMERTTEWSLLTLTLPSLVFFFWISKYRGLRFLVTYCVSDVSIAAVDYLAYVLCMIIFGEADTFWSFPIKSLMCVGAAALVYFFIRPHYAVALHELKRGWSVMLVVVVLAYGLMSLLSAYPTPIAERPEDAVVSIVSMIFLEAMIVVLVYLIANMLTAQIKTRRENEMALRLQLAKQQYDSLSTSVEQTRAVRHDLKHHLQVIKTMCEQGNYQRLQEYLQSDIIQDEGAVPQFCMNYVANLLLQHYAALSADSGVSFRCRANLPEKLQLDDAALTTLLGNALSNALEAVENVSTKQREIEVLLNVKQNTLVMKVRNTCAAPPEEKDGALISAKGEGHGYGLASIQHLANRSDGLCQWSYADGFFLLDVAIPL